MTSKTFLEEEEAQPVVRANERAWHVGCGAAFGAKHARGSPVTFGKKRKFTMNASAAAVLAEIKVKRDVRDHDVSFRDYWKTYALMAIYAVAFFVLELGLKMKMSEGLYFLAVLVIVARAIQDTQSASNRRFGALVELLEKRNIL